MWLRQQWPMSRFGYFDKLKDRMNYIHICNNDGMTDAHKRLDEGIIPIKTCLQSLPIGSIMVMLRANCTRRITGTLNYILPIP